MENPGEPRAPDEEFYTISEAARILHVPQRRILDWLAAGEIDGDRHPVSGRWRVPKGSLEESVPAKESEEELAWSYERERLLSQLYGERARAERERERADRLQQQVEALRREIEVGRMRKEAKRGPSGARD